MTDAAQSASNASKPTPKPDTKPSQKQAGSGGLLFLMLVTFLISIGGIGAGYYAWVELQKQLATASDERQNLMSSWDSLNSHSDFVQLRRQLSGKIDGLATQVQKNSENIDHILENQEAVFSSVEKVFDYTNRSQAAWIRKEIDYVLRIAQYRLSLSRDLASARAALMAADDRLAELSDPVLIPVRKSIARQIQKLDSVSQPDYVGLELKIDTLLANLRNYILEPADQNAAQTSEISQAVEEPTDQVGTSLFKDIWEKSVALVKKAFSNTVTVTRGEHSVAIFIEEQEKKRAYEFLHAKLIGAKYAVSTHDDVSYHQQMEAALAWLNENQQIHHRAELIQQITQLNRSDLLPELPDISEPYRQLQELTRSEKAVSE
ncbi:MAG: uroporphyrinogen-III C-methyltransferase [Planctomycetaceae bacterium]|nr:uroporphyrinogen-III C-methyltransferase [Planctomycetaceae bacterium]